MSDLGCVNRNNEAQRYEITVNLTTNPRYFGNSYDDITTTNNIVTRTVEESVFGDLRTALNDWTDDTDAVMKRMDAIFKLKGDIGDRCFNFNVR